MKLSRLGIGRPDGKSLKPPSLRAHLIFMAAACIIYASFWMAAQLSLDPERVRFANQLWPMPLGVIVLTLLNWLGGRAFSAVMRWLAKKMDEDAQKP